MLRRARCNVECGWRCNIEDVGSAESLGGAYG